MSVVEIRTRKGSRMVTIIDKIVDAGRCILITKSGRVLDINPKNLLIEYPL